MWYDTLLAILIVLGLLLIVASRVTKQTISEMIGSIIDMIREKKENAEQHMEVYA